MRAFLVGTIFVVVAGTALPEGTISEPAYRLLSTRTAANQARFYVDVDQDSGFNHGFPSGFFASDGNLGTIHINTGCIYDAAGAGGCSGDPNALDRTRGTVMQITFDPQAPGRYAGVNIEEPENWGVLKSGTGDDLRGATSLMADMVSPDNATIQVGVGGCNTPF